MRKTLIVSVFSGCGKTWLTKHQQQFGYVILDYDSSVYEKSKDWAARYVTDLMEQVFYEQYDFIFICQTGAVLDELDARGIPYVIVEPDNIIWNIYETTERKRIRQLIKQQWLGRLVLRDNSHIKDFPGWFQHIKETYDQKTSLDFIDAHQQRAFFLLRQDQYLSDIIDDLYWKKEHHDIYTL